MIGRSHLWAARSGGFNWATMEDVVLCWVENVRFPSPKRKGNASSLIIIMKKERKTGRGEDDRMKIVFNVYSYKSGGVSENDDRNQFVGATISSFDFAILMNNTKSSMISI